MGVSTQEMEKNPDDALPSRKEKEAGLDNGIDDGNRGNPVAFLKVRNWSLTSERIATSVKEAPIVYPIFKGANVIGRSKASSICFPFSVISARHAAIDVKETLHTVRDHVSTNETKRNGVALEPDVRYEIFDGTELSFADIECTYYVGRLPDAVEADGLKLDAAFEWKSKEQDSRRSSTGASTTAMTIFKNFLSDDEDSREMLGQEDVPEGTDIQASRISAPAACRKNDNAVPALDVLVEESQFIADERPSLESVFANASKNLQHVVRETEQFLIDDDVPTIDSTECAIEKRRGNDILETHPVQPGEYEDDDHASHTASANEPKNQDQEIINPAITETKNSTSSIRDDSSLEAAIQSDVAIRDEDAPMAETLAYLGGLPVPLDSLKVDHRLNLLAGTPASSANGKTPQTAGTNTAGRNQTSVWSIPTSDQSSNRTKRKRSLMDEAVTDWLFRSEPDMRRKNGRTAAASRRRTTVDKPKNRFEDLSAKCNQSIIAAKRVSKEKKAAEVEASDANIVQLVSEVAAKVKDPFEFGPSQMTFSAGSAASGSFRTKPSKKVQKARKSVKSSSDSDAASTVTPIASKSASERKRSNDEARLDEARFDEAAETSRQQRCKAKTQKKEDDRKNPVQCAEGGESTEFNTATKKVLLVEPKAEKAPDETTDTNEENSTDSGVMDVVSFVQHSRRTNPKADGRSFVIDEVPHEAPKPKKPRAAAKKKQPIGKSKRPEEPENDLSEESPELHFPEKPQRKKAAASGGRAKAEKEDTKATTATKKAPKRGIGVKQEMAPAIKVCFTQLSDKDQLAKLEQAVKEMKGEIVDSGVECTHLVVPKFGRSVKFMCAVGRGIPIVTPEWVEKSKVAGHFLDTDKFIISDKAEEKRLDFNLRTCLNNARESMASENKRLFDGYVFYSTESVRPNRGDMKAIVTAAGGRFLENLPKSVPKNDKFVALSCEADAETTDVKRLKTMQVPIVSMEFVLTGLLKREIGIEKYTIFKNEASTADEAPKRRKRVKVESSASSQTSSVEPSRTKKTAQGKK